MPEGQVGQLVVGGVGLARYLDGERDAQQYAAVPVLGWQRTYRNGDLVRHDGTGLIFHGRADYQVKTGGRRIELGEIDAVLLDLPGVSAAAAAVRRTGSGNAVLVGYLTLSSTPASVSAFDPDAAKAHLRAVLPAALVPRLAVVDALPTKTSGKSTAPGCPGRFPQPPPLLLGVGLDPITRSCSTQDRMCS